MLFRNVTLFKRFCLLYVFGGYGKLERFRLFFAQDRLRLGDVGFRAVFTLDRLRFGFRHADTLLHFGVRFADRTFFVLFRDGDLRIVDGFCRRLFSERGYVTRFVGNIGHVYVDQTQTDLFEFAFHVAGNRFEEFIAVGVDLFDVHGGDDETELTEDNVARQIGYLRERKHSEPLRGILHDRRIGGDPDGEDAGYVDTDILFGKRAFEIDRDRKRRQIHKRVLLEERPHERRAAVDTFGAAVRSVGIGRDFTVDHHDLIGRTGFVAYSDREQDHKDDEHDRDDYGNDCRGHVSYSPFFKFFLFSKHRISRLRSK